MMITKKMKQNAMMKGETAIAVISVPGILGTNLAAQIVILWLSAQDGVFPGADIFMSIVSTCSQIIAGLYGTTLAGYTFFLSRIDALTASDVTLDYVVASIKKRFKYLIWYITFNVLATLTISVALMYAPVPEESQIGYFYRLFCNEFLLFLGFSTVLILYYSIRVIDPNCVEKEAEKLKKKISRRGPAGSAMEFIGVYDRIVAACNGMIPANVLEQIHENKGKRFEYTITLLSEQSVLLPLIADLNRIHRYYECVVNCKSIGVTEEMCILARRVLGFLENTGKRAVTSK